MPAFGPYFYHFALSLFAMLVFGAAAYLSAKRYRLARYFLWGWAVALCIAAPFIAFVIGDIYAHHYERNASGSQQKEIASLIKGRLLQITCVKVDGEVVYRLDRDSGLVTTTLNLAEAPAKRDGTNG